MGKRLDGRLVTRDTVNPSIRVATVTPEGASACYVTGVAAGTTTVSCNYKYDAGEAVITSWWHCKITVVGSGGGGGSVPTSFACNPTSLTLDLAKPSEKGYLSFTLSGTSGLDYYVSMGVRKGYPKTVSYRSQATSENGSPVFYNKACTLATMKVGSETIKFSLVHLVEVDGYGRFFSTSYETPVDVTVTCSHTFGDGVVIREGSEYQDEIIEYTCGACGEKRVEERAPLRPIRASVKGYSGSTMGRDTA